MKRRALLLAGAGLALLPSGAFATTVADAVFGANLIGAVKEPEQFHYAYEMTGDTLQQPVTSDWLMEVRKIDPDGGKQVYFELFSGSDQRHFGPISAREQNPLVLVFLQRDVAAMSNLTGGAQGYFQQQIRRKFSEAAESEQIEIEVDGKKVPATKLVMHPFRDDPSIMRFPKYKEKAYEFIVSPEVPGGVYRLASSTPDPATGKVILAETVTFSHVGGQK
ncbi:MAG: hypothetical protein U1E45_23310 [Geminicoccaceae bacterium]